MTEVQLPKADPTAEQAPTRLPSTATPAPTGGWTLKKLAAWLEGQFHRTFSRETIRRALKRLHLSWKKGKKLLNRADPEKRQLYLDELKGLLGEATISDDLLLVYIDEAHIHQDADLAYGWSERGGRLWVPSSSPGLKAKASFYGIYLYSEGQVRIWDYDRANGDNTIDVLTRLRREFPERKVALIWDGAPYHRSTKVREAAKEKQFQLHPLPAYSPDFMPVEALWRWLRQEVTANHCHQTRGELCERVAAFAQKINADPCALADRLWVKDELVLEEEERRAHPLGPRSSAALGVPF